MSGCQKQPLEDAAVDLIGRDVRIPRFGGFSGDGSRNAMRLILSRHGNTFAPGEKPIWLGAHDDPPLVSEGERQSLRLADALIGAGIRPSAIFAGPLLRMCVFAEILAARLGLGTRPIIDPRLNEIDYGGWNGLTNEEVVERYGGRDFYDWYERNIWPSAGWNSDRTPFEAAVRNFVRTISDNYDPGQTAVAVTSHGVLKCLGSELRDRRTNGFARGWHRVDTGNICELSCNGAHVQVVSWNARPDLALSRALTV